MSDEQQRELRYKSLGARLKRIRERLQESLAEVSGAVEIDISTLEDIEKGTFRPSEDILELLLSHFEIKTEEAERMWKLAGYEASSDTLPGKIEADNQNVTGVMVMPFDVRIAYTDQADVSANKYGVTINFMQSDGPNRQPLVVSRLGMSKEHTQSLIDMLQKVLHETQPKSLPDPRKSSKKKDHK